MVSVATVNPQANKHKARFRMCFCVKGDMLLSVLGSFSELPAE